MVWLLILQKEIVLVDAAWDDKMAKQWLDMNEKEFKKTVKLAILTHHKYDRIGGIQAQLDQKIKMVSTPETARLAKEFNYPMPDPSPDSIVSTLKLEIWKSKHASPEEKPNTATKV